MAFSPTSRRSSRRPFVLEVLEDRTVPSVLFEPGQNRPAVYLGGPIFPSVHVELVLWGSGWTVPPLPNQASAFDVQNAVDSILNPANHYMDGLAQYRIGAGFRVGTVITGATIPGDVDPPTIAMMQTFSQYDVSTMLQRDIALGALPAPQTDPQMMYIVITEPGTDFVALQGGQQIDAGGYHNWALAPGNVPFAYGFGENKDGTLDPVTAIFTHELVEAVTDPQPVGPTDPLHPEYALMTYRPGWQIAPVSAGNEMCDGRAQLYYYRQNGYLVQSYFSALNQAFIVPTGQMQNFAVDSNRVLYVLGDQFGPMNDSVIMDVNALGGVSANLNGEQVDFDLLTPAFLGPLGGQLNITAVSINPGMGSNVVTLRATLAGVPTGVTMLTGVGDTLNLGDPMNGVLDNLQGPVVWNLRPATVNLSINDQGEFRPGDVYTLTASTLQRTGGAGIGLIYPPVNSVTLNAGSGIGDTVTVASTGANTVTIVNVMGAGPYTVNIGNVGNGLLDNIRGPIFGNSQFGTTDVVLNDQSDNRNGDRYSITANTFTRTGLAGNFTFAGLRSLTLNSGSGNDIINLQSTALGVPVTINTGNGNNTINLSPTAQNLNNLQSQVTVNGGFGNNTLNLYDQNAPFVDNYTATDNQTTVGRLMLPIDYTGLTTVDIWANPASMVNKMTVFVTLLFNGNPV
jgi:hypothetical protein